MIAPRDPSAPRPGAARRPGRLRLLHAAPAAISALQLLTAGTLYGEPERRRAAPAIFSLLRREPL